MLPQENVHALRSLLRSLKSNRDVSKGKEEGLHIYVGVSNDRLLYNKPYTLDAQKKNRFRKKVVSPMA